MKKEAKNRALVLQPMPQAIVSCRDNNGRDNALVVGFAANVSLEPAMIMIGVTPERFSHHMIKESGCFIINLPTKEFKKEYNYLGSHSGRDEDKFAVMNIKSENGTVVNAPILSDCPVSIECSIVESTMPGTHELFVGKVEAVHCDEQYLDANGKINWSTIDLL